MLVTLEGLDGSGKTTVWRELEGRFPDAVLTREPTESWYGDAVRRSVGDDAADPVAELFLYCADHADHLRRVVEPALASDRLVVSDRYVDSRVAYQGVTLRDHVDDPLGYVRRLHRPFTIEPDLTCYLAVDLETALDRGDGATKFERRSFLAEVQAAYREILEREPDRFVIIDAERDVPAVVDDVVGAIEARRAGP